MFINIYFVNEVGENDNMNLWNINPGIKLFRTKQDVMLEKARLAKTPSPMLPSELTKTQAKILQAAIERGEVVGGSFAQKALFPSARKFQDIDIISKNPRETAEYLRKKIRIPTRAEMGRHGKYTIKHAASGKVIADVVPSMYYEKYIKQYGGIPTADVSGVKVLREDVLFREKLGAAKYGNPKIRSKILGDIKFLSEP